LGEYFIAVIQHNTAF